MKKLIVLFILIISISQAKAETIDLNSVIDQASKNSFDLKISQIDINISNTAIKEAKSEYYPNISFMYNQEYALDFNNNTNNFGSVGSTFVNNSTKFQNLFATKFEQNIYDFGIRGKQLSIAKKDLTEKQYLYKQKLRDLKLLLTDLYSKALVDYADIKARENILPVYNDLFEIKQKLYTSGITSKLDIMTEAVNIAKATDQIEQSKTSLTTNLSDLSLYTYTKYDSSIDLTPIEDENTQANLSTLLFKQTVAEDVFLPYETYEFKIHQLEIEKKQNELDILKRQRYPIVKFYTNYILYGSDPSNYLKSFEEIRSRNILIGLTASLPLFDGFKNIAQRDKVLLEIEKLKLEQEKISYEIKNKFNKYYDYYKALQNELAAKESLVTANYNKLNALNRLSQQSLIDKSQLLSYKAEVLNEELELNKVKIRLKSTLKQLEILLEGP